MGGKIPRNIKEKVIRQWLNGLTRERIAKENDIGTGTVTVIIQEARKQEEYQDIDLLREVSLKSKEEGLELPELGFAIRLRIKMQYGPEWKIDPPDDFLPTRIEFHIPVWLIREIPHFMWCPQKYGIR